jgi:hypothetical protein
MILLLEAGAQTAPSFSANPGDPLTEQELASLQPGDIILRQGSSLISRLIEQTLAEEIPLSHIALIVERPQGLGVIHSISSSLSGIDGIQFQPLGDFVLHSEPGTTIVLRPRLSGEKTNKILAKAETLLDQEVPFDHSLTSPIKRRSIALSCLLFYWRG